MKPTMPHRFRPSLFDRLFDEAGTSDAGTQRLHSVTELKASVARDLESLLNSRRGMKESSLARYPLVRRSVAAFGMDDFVSLSLLSPDDRLFICRSIERAIADHESRLRKVRVGITSNGSSLQKLHFSIEGWLVLLPDQEPVHFDATLQTLTQHYSVRPAHG